MNQNGTQPVGVPAEPVAVLGEGAVNFDANLVADSAATAADVVQASPSVESVEIGGTKTPAVVEKRVVPPTTAHTINLSLNVTLGTGFSYLRGVKGLKSVAITSHDGTEEKFNFYNPFVKGDKDKQTHEGLLRKTFGAISTLAHQVLGREAVFIGDTDNINTSINNLVQNVIGKLREKFPLTPDTAVFEVDITVDGKTFPRPVLFSELFAVECWVVSQPADEDFVVVHDVNFNIICNIGAMYDSTEPHTFVKRVQSFIEGQLDSRGLREVVDYHVNYAFDSSTLAEPEVRDVIELMVEEEFEIVSRNGVLTDKYGWIKPNQADALFAFGCDLILRSPSVFEEEGEEGEGDAEEGSE